MPVLDFVGLTGVGRLVAPFSKASQNFDSFIKQNIIVAERNRVQAGAVYIDCSDADVAVIDNVYVGSDHRRKGVGEALVKGVSNWAQGLGAKVAEAKIFSGNTESIQFFESLGFKLDRYGYGARVTGEQLNTPAQSDAFTPKYEVSCLGLRLKTANLSMRLFRVHMLRLGLMR